MPSFETVPPTHLCARPKTVEFTLEAAGNATIVRLRHYGLPRPTVEKHCQVWLHAGLVKIKDSAEGRRPTATCVSEAATARGMNERTIADSLAPG
jgi:hypothetical protein